MDEINMGFLYQFQFLLLYRGECPQAAQLSYHLIQRPQDAADAGAQAPADQAEQNHQDTADKAEDLGGGEDVLHFAV